jgi:hypothetical protein
VIEEEITRLHSDLKHYFSVLRYVARKRLVQMGKPSVCATVNWKVHKTAIVLYFKCD